MSRQDSAARIQQPGFSSQESVARIQQPGFSCQESVARRMNHHLSLRTMVTQGIHERGLRSWINTSYFIHFLPDFAVSKTTFLKNPQSLSESVTLLRAALIETIHTWKRIQQWNLTLAVRSPLRTMRTPDAGTPKWDPQTDP